MVEKWQLHLAKSEQNIEAANLLFDKGIYSLAAYHAQQALELSIKACVFRFGFEEYLRLKRITELGLDFVLEQGRDPLHHHNPSGVILRASYKFCHDEVERLKSKQDIDSNLIPMFEEILDATGQILNLMREMDKNKQVKLEVWKGSLGGIIKHEETNRLIAAIKKSSESRVVERFLEASFNWLFRRIHWLIAFAAKTHQLHKIQTVVIPEARQLLEASRLPTEFANTLFSGKEDVYQNSIHNFVAEKGAWNALNIVLRPGGLMEIGANWGKTNPEIARVDEKELPLTDIRNYYVWISYIVAMSYPMILLYPHEEFGRYPATIDGRDTEVIYAESKSELRNRIDDCMEANKIIKGLILNQDIQES